MPDSAWESESGRSTMSPDLMFSMEWRICNIKSKEIPRRPNSFELSLPLRSGGNSTFRFTQQDSGAPPYHTAAEFHRLSPETPPLFSVSPSPTSSEWTLERSQEVAPIFSLCYSHNCLSRWSPIASHWPSVESSLPRHRLPSPPPFHSVSYFTSFPARQSTAILYCFCWTETIHLSLEDSSASPCSHGFCLYCSLARLIRST